MAVPSNVDSAFNLQHSNFKFSPRRRNVETLLGCPFGYECTSSKKVKIRLSLFYPHWLRDFFFENFFHSKAKIYVTFVSTISKNNFQNWNNFTKFFEQTIDLAVHLQRWKRWTFLALRMQKIRWIPTSKFVFRERKAQVFILISLIPTLALSCPLRKPNLLHLP